MIDLPREWHVLHVPPALEFAVVGRLERADIRPFLPTYRTKIGNKNNRKAVKRPLFPGYVLAEFADVECWRVLDRSGAIAVLGWGDPEAGARRLAVVARPLVMALIRECPMSEAQYRQMIRKHIEAINRDLELGERVRVIDGPFSSFGGPIVKIDDAGRIGVEMRLFGSLRTLEFTRSQLETERSAPDVRVTSRRCPGGARAA